MRQKSPPRRSAWIARFSFIALLCLSIAGALWPATGYADGVADEAELHFQLGAEAYQKADFRGALEHFLLSNRLVSNRNVVFNIARAFEQLQQYADAHRYYVDALQGETNPKTRTELESALGRVSPSVAVLDVETTPPGATIYIDRQDLGSRGSSPRPLGLPAGTYRVIAELAGYETTTSPPIEAKVGTQTKVALTLERIVGTLKIDVKGAPNAAVHVDDERAPVACTAPCELPLPPGQHTIYFTREGFSAPSRQVNIAAKQTIAATASLTPLTGALVVSADERDALVEVDGRPMGFTPAVIQAVDVGRRRVRVSLRGYTAVERDVDIKANKQAELLDLKLTPVREVTAVSRFAENIDDAPSSVTILDGQELRAFAYPTIAESLRGVRGIYLSNDGAYVSAGIRGLGEPADYGNRVLVLSDGQSLNDNLLNSSYIGSDARADLEDIDRIEVVRGPGSLLYGTGAFSGVINLVTRPRDEPDSVHVGAGVYDNNAAHARAGFHYSFARDAGMWASASAARSDGRDLAISVTDPESGPPTLTASGVDRFLSGGTAGRVWWGALTAQWFYHRRTQVVPTGDYGTIVGDPGTQNTDSRIMGELRFEPQLSDSVQLMTRVHANRYRYEGDFQYDPSPATPNVEDYAGTWFGGEARLVITPTKGLRLTAGGEVQAHTVASIDGCCDDDGLVYIEENKPFNFGAGYGLIEASPADWFRVSAGARVDVYSTFGPIVVPRVGLIFKPQDKGVLKLMGGRAFRAPSIYEQVYNDGGISQVPAEDESRGLSLDPESVIQGEVEYSYRFKEDWIALMAVHGSYIQDIIGTEEDSPDVIRYVNSGDPVLALGGDLELRREWRQGWMLSAMAGYQRARYLGSELSNTRAINYPEALGSFKGVVPVVPDLASVGLRVSLEAPRRIRIDSDDRTKTAAVADLVLSGHIRRYGLRYAVGLYNLADWRYEVPVSDTQIARTFEQKGRTFLANLVATYP